MACKCHVSCSEFICERPFDKHRGWHANDYPYMYKYKIKYICKYQKETGMLDNDSIVYHIVIYGLLSHIYTSYIADFAGLYRILCITSK